MEHFLVVRCQVTATMMRDKDVELGFLILIFGTEEIPGGALTYEAGERTMGMRERGAVGDDVRLHVVVKFHRADLGHDIGFGELRVRRGKAVEALVMDFESSVGIGVVLGK